MPEQRLSKSERKRLFTAVLHQYHQSYIEPLIQLSPYLRTLNQYSLKEPLETLLFTTLKALVNHYSEKTYQQLQHAIEQDRLSTTERQHLENGIKAINQKLVSDNQKLNQNKKDWYRNDRSHFIKHPLKNKKPDKSRYQSFNFIESDSPFTLDHAYKILALTFQALAEEQARLDFKSTQKLETDKERDRQDQIINQKTGQLAQAHHEIKDKTYDLLAKEDQLKRELEQLKHLTHIVKGYTLSEDQDHLTSPAEQIEALEKLLEQKRRG